MLGHLLLSKLMVNQVGTYGAFTCTFIALCSSKISVIFDAREQVRESEQLRAGSASAALWTKFAAITVTTTRRQRWCLDHYCFCYCGSSAATKSYSSKAGSIIIWWQLNAAV